MCIKYHINVAISSKNAPSKLGCSKISQLAEVSKDIPSKLENDFKTLQKLTSF